MVVLLKGKLIVIEGTDGSGKTTQLNLLKEKLVNEGYPVETIDFPQYGQKSAALIEEYLSGKFGSANEVGPYRASIFYACDRYAVSAKIKSWLDSGKIILSNRYATSNMGHQAGKIKDKKDRDKFLRWLYDLEFKIFGIPEPDVVVFLYIDPGIAQKLALARDAKSGKVIEQRKDIHQMDINHLKSASEAYKYVAKKYKWIKVDCNYGKKGIKEIKDIHEQVYKIVKKQL